jgi:hypothetical protein
MDPVTLDESSSDPAFGLTRMVEPAQEWFDTPGAPTDIWCGFAYRINRGEEKCRQL